MESIFLSKTNLTKLNILKKILFAPTGIYINELFTEKDRTRKTALRYIDNINDDLQSLFPDNSITIEKFKNIEIYIIKNDSNYDIDFIIDVIRNKYVKESNIYIVLMCLFTNKIHSVNQLSLELNISTSNLYLTLKKINTLLEPFKVTVSITNSTNNFIGNELGIRLSSYFLCWSLFREENTFKSFSSVSTSYFDISSIKKSLKFTNTMSRSIEVRLRIIQSVNLQRILSSKENIHLSDSFYKDSAFLYQNNIVFEEKIEASLKKTNDLSLISKEKRFIDFSIKLLLYDTYSFEYKEKIVRLYSTSKLEIAKNVEFFIDNFKNYFSLNISYSDYIELYYIFILLFIFTKYIKIDFSSLIPYGIPSKKIMELFPQYHVFEKKMQTFVKEQAIYFNLDFTSKTMTQLLIWVFYLIKKTDPVKICVQTTNSLYLSQAIKKVITDFLPSTGFLFSNDLNNIDIIITDSYEGTNSTVKKFYFGSPHDSQTWIELINFINQQRWEKRWYWDFNLFDDRL
ncbi:hypothetical protein BH746_11785 [Enterococcus faecalis]|uniref:helix-turn-helix domain-containing protein n=1 Tax=Enterococcus faecalis TaxID=1351 RepID=UPI0009C13B78|nr:helix-turn-helix domain-containing protein [Enterococcus faecalis]OQO72575.1 hypothetical protein BH746_11785 [Enterococcus faecalis]